MEFINPSFIILIVLIMFVIITLLKGIQIVPQGFKLIVQRLGKYQKTLHPGLNILIPFIDEVAFKVTTKDIVLDIPSQDVITKDNAVIVANAVAYINILAPEKAVYGVEDYELAIRTLVQTGLRSIVGEMNLDGALSSRELIKANLKNMIAAEIQDWGITLNTVEIQDILPSQTMQAAMEEQAAAERKRRATVTTAEGDKEAQILEADGRLEASRRDAEAKIVLAEASRKSIDLVTSAIQESNSDMPVTFLLGEKYIGALDQLGKSSNAKTVVLPADILGSIKQMFSKG